MVIGQIDSFQSPIEATLDPGEKLLWSGQPKQGMRLQGQDIFLIPFSLMWGGFAIFWEAAALGIGLSHQHRPVSENAQWVAWVFPLWGIPFVAVGLYLIIGRFFFDANARRKTWYGLTDQRLIILKWVFARHLTSFDLRNLPSLNLVERADASGDILCGPQMPMASFAASGWPGNGRYLAPGFYLLPGARQIYNRIREAQRAIDSKS